MTIMLWGGLAQADNLAQGVWHWHPFPSAVQWAQRAVTGWAAIDDDGDVLIQARFLESDGRHGPVITLDKYDGNQDDHQSPAFAVAGDHVVAVWTPRWPEPQAIRVARIAADSTVSGIQIIADGLTYRDYPQVFHRGGGHMVIFYRGGNSRGGIWAAESTDYGLTWGKPWVLFDVAASEWTYALFRQTGARIDAAFNVNVGAGYRQLRFATTENLYQWEGAGGQIITADARAQPITEATAELIEPDGGARVYDLRRGAAGVYVTSYTGMDNVGGQATLLRHFKRPGQPWHTSSVTTTGIGLSRRPSATSLGDAHVGGIIIDAAAPDTSVVISKERAGILEIERWSSDDGLLWERSERITSGSVEHQFRPRFVEGNAGHKLLWLAGYFQNFSATSRPQPRTDRPWQTAVVSDRSHRSQMRETVPLQADAGRNIIPLSTHAGPETDLGYNGGGYGGSNFSQPLFRAGGDGLPLWSTTSSGTMQLYVRLFARPAAFLDGATNATVALRMSPYLVFEEALTQPGQVVVTPWLPVPSLSTERLVMAGKVNAGRVRFDVGQIGLQFGIGAHTLPHSAARRE